MKFLLDKKLEKYLPPQDYFEQGLYMLDVGQNDLDGAFNSKSEDQVIAFIPTILSQFESGIQVGLFLSNYVKLSSFFPPNNNT